MSGSKTVLKVVAVNYWGQLSPQFQSTSLADTLLGNVFEPLVDLSPSGGIAPGVAERWEVNEDNTVFIFRLSESHKFSDGTPVRAEHFIQSWLAPFDEQARDTAKPNTLDVLYKVKGFSQSKRAEEIEGLQALDDKTLRVEFSEPFRTALYELTGTRFAAWKRDASGKVIGSGGYVIKEQIPGEKILFTKNEHAHVPSVYEEIHVEGYLDAWKAMKSGDWPLMLGPLPFGEWNEDVEFLGGRYAVHTVMDVNGTKESLFSNPNYRLAIQYAVHVPVRDELKRKFGGSLDTNFDAQFYPELWPGRLDGSEANALVMKGAAYLDEFARVTRERPIRFVFREGLGEEIAKSLAGLGIGLRSLKPVDSKTLIETVYAKHDFDITLGGASVLGNDPDGVYHLLGREGAIATEQIFRERTAMLLDRGRTLKRSADLHSFYQDVSRAILTEVPVIHVRFEPASAFYNKRRVRPAIGQMNSDRFSFNRLEVK